MKEPFSLTPGRVVQSLQGRDRGGFFLIVGQAGEDVLLLADGRRHRLSAPKKKKCKHVKAKPVQLDLSALRAEGGPLQDSDIRNALETHGFAVKRSLCKED